jgi:integrase
MRRIFSSFFGWLEDEDYIFKSPVRRIRKIKTEKTIKDTFSDEGLELFRDACEEIRDLAMIDLLASTGMRVGELVQLNSEDINFHERECVVLGCITDPPHERLMIGGVETRLREIGKRADMQKVHPHKFRRTLATRAIDKGMPIEQV